MTQTQIVLIVLLLLAAVAIGAVILTRRRKSARLTSKFGTEYSRVVDEAGRAKGEAGLVAREKRLEAVAIAPLSQADHDQFAQSWAKVQTEFVDDPKFSVTHAQHLLEEVMTKRGYPVGDFEQRAADISVDHGKVVENYRAVHAILVRHDAGGASTEDLRQAMILFRSLFAELVGETVPVAAAPSTSPPVAA